MVDQLYNSSENPNKDCLIYYEKHKNDSKNNSKNILKYKIIFYDENALL